MSNCSLKLQIWPLMGTITRSRETCTILFCSYAKQAPPWFDLARKMRRTIMNQPVPNLRGRCNRGKYVWQMLLNDGWDSGDARETNTLKGTIPAWQRDLKFPSGIWILQSPATPLCLRTYRKGKPLNTFCLSSTSSEIFVCVLLTSNHMVFLVQFGINQYS